MNQLLNRRIYGKAHETCSFYASSRNQMSMPRRREHHAHQLLRMAARRSRQMNGTLPTDFCAARIRSRQRPGLFGTKGAKRVCRRASRGTRHDGVTRSSHLRTTLHVVTSPANERLRLPRGGARPDRASTSIRMTFGRADGSTEHLCSCLTMPHHDQRTAANLQRRWLHAAAGSVTRRRADQSKPISGRRSRSALRNPWRRAIRRARRDRSGEPERAIPHRKHPH